MQRITLENALTERSYKLNGQVAYGIEQRYGILLSIPGKGSIKYLSFTLTLENAPSKQLKADLKAALKGIGTCTFSVDHITVGVKLPSETLAPYETALQTTLSVLNQEGAMPVSACPVCHQGNCDIYAQVGSGYRPTHGGCMEGTLSVAQEKARLNEENGNYFTGIIGGILGALVGVIPNVLTIWFGNTIFAMLFALIPLCIYGGYRLFNGKLNKIYLVINIILSLMSVYLIEIILLSASLVTEGYTTMAELPAALAYFLSDLEVWQLLTEDAGFISFAFIALGIFIAWSAISKTHISQVKTVQSAMETVLPNPEYAGSAPSYESYMNSVPKMVQNEPAQNEPAQSAASVLEHEAEGDDGSSTLS